MGLGDHGRGTNRNNPTLILSIPPIKNISAGGNHSLLLDVNGGVWSFGYNRNGQLGLGDKTNRDKPNLIPDILPIKDISGGRCHSILLDVNGSVWSFGYNGYGQLGLGDHGRGTNRNNPTRVPGIPPIKKVSGGRYHSILLDINGDVWSFGSNVDGQLGLGDHGIITNKNKPTLIPGIPPIKKVSGVGQQSLLLS